MNTQYTDRLAIMTYYLKVDEYLIDEAKKNPDLRPFIGFLRELTCSTLTYPKGSKFFFVFEKHDLGLNKNFELAYKTMKTNEDILQQFIWCTYTKVCNMRNREDLPFLHSLYDDIQENDLTYRVAFGKMFMWIRSLEINEEK